MCINVFIFFFEDKRGQEIGYLEWGLKRWSFQIKKKKKKKKKKLIHIWFHAKLGYYFYILS